MQSNRNDWGCQNPGFILRIHLFLNYPFNKTTCLTKINYNKKARSKIITCAVKAMVIFLGLVLT